LIFHVAVIRTVRFSNDGARILTVSEDGTAKIWVPVSESTEDAPTYATAHSDIIYQFDISRDGKKLVTGSYDRTARIWDTETRMLLATYDGHESEIVAVDFNNDASHAGSLDATGSLHVWDVATGRRRFAIDPESDAFARHINEAGAGLRNEILSFPGSMSTGIFSPDNSHVVLFHEDSMKAFRASDGSIRVVLEGADACGWPVFSFDSKLVSVLEMNGRTAGVWDLTTGEQVTRLKGHRASMVMMNFSPIDNRIVTGAMDGRTIIWDALTGEAIHNLDVDSSFITTCRFSSDGRFVLTGDAGLCRVWDANTGELLTNLSGHTARTCDIRMSPDQTRFVSWAMDDQIIIWDFARPEAHPLLTFRSRKASKPLESSQLLQAHWTPDGRDIITAWVDGRIEVWSGATRNDLLDFDGRGDNFEADFDNWRARSMNRFADH
jgi:WD40 repeat protein